MKGRTNGLRILIVEDSPVIALAIEDMLHALGHVPLGPVGNMASALEMARTGQMDAAVVDLNVRGTKTFALLKILDDRNVPFLIISGYADWKMPNEWLARPRLQKPFSERQLREKLAEVLPTT
jgi:CheY-like chemotaxis protein